MLEEIREVNSSQNADNRREKVSSRVLFHSRQHARIASCSLLWQEQPCLHTGKLYPFTWYRSLILIVGGFPCRENHYCLYRNDFYRNVKAEQR